MMNHPNRNKKPIKKVILPLFLLLIVVAVAFSYKEFVTAQGAGQGLEVSPHLRK